MEYFCLFREIPLPYSDYTVFSTVVSTSSLHSSLLPIVYIQLYHGALQPHINSSSNASLLNA